MDPVLAWEKRVGASRAQETHKQMKALDSIPSPLSVCCLPWETNVFRRGVLNPSLSKQFAQQKVSSFTR